MISWQTHVLIVNFLNPKAEEFCTSDLLLFGRKGNHLPFASKSNEKISTVQLTTIVVNKGDYIAK